MVCFYGMKEMIYRTTFALDKGTIGRLKRLSRVWHVSQAEVVRRAIALADEAAANKIDPATLLKTLHKSGKLLTHEQAKEYLSQIHNDRQSWRGEA